ncbi:Bug family tripartite tricarboxylate transporter substrate binding protein [Pararoseomonas indoligenes]|uniref:Tripartite tricarboxylate transporter substrate binding protein n=1 Tax=Roseomonas indoligenes TaxID=2820811 RepID=A0A940S6V0_9PROT|nr:tripartite tricarboxylate transporter substrate binding protein [Pararoseomonas indoligenes]MBP0492388.1 tripartite tricarboxylate transporter substrate binding protein [Pararoseomonas indoligenes]
MWRDRPPGRRAALRALAAAALATGPLAAGVRPAAAQAYPARPIRLIVTFPPGGSSDVIGRILAPRIEARLGQPLVIDNRPGAGGNIGMDIVAKAAPDGYTLGIGAAGALSVNPSLYPNMPYDTLRDLAPVTMLAGIPFVLVANPRIGVKTLPELVALAKSRPGVLTVAHGGNGTAMHLSAELFNQMAGLRIETIPFRGSAPAMTAAVSGDTDLAVVDLASVSGLTAGGQLVVLGVTTPARVSSLREAPTIAEAGLPGYESVGWFGLVAPARTPAAAVEALNAAFTAVLREPEIRARLESIGTVAQPGTAEDFASFIRSETAKWAGVIRAAGTKVE